MLRNIWVFFACMVRGHRDGELYRWRHTGFRVVPGCLRCKAEFDKEAR